MFQKSIISGLLALVVLFSVGCSGTPKGNRMNLFSLNDDIKLGKQVSGEIESKPAEYPILDKAKNPKAYQHIERITKKILNSGNVQNKNRFAWQVKIINDDETLNAFATPGGYIYVYTGLINYLDSEDQLAGVMGHEIAHADLRHSTRSLTKMYGISTLSSVLLGNKNALKQVTDGLVSLSFSRSHETESDEYSVIYLCGTDYNAAGAAGFFEKIEKGGGGRPPAFLSTHPNPGNRVAKIKKKKRELGCKGTGTFVKQYQDFKNALKNKK